MLVINRDMVRNPALTDLDIAVYVYILADVYGPNKRYGYISGSSILAQMNGGKSATDKMKSRVSKSIEHLVEEGYIVGSHMPGSRLYQIDSQGFGGIENYFTVEREVLDKIVASSYQPISVLRQYLLILSGINYRTKCCIWRYEAFAGVTGKDSKTISAYINALEKMKLIYIYKSNLHTSNTYGRYEDREAIESFGKVRMTPNDKRRVAQLRNRGEDAFMYEDDLFG